MALGTPSWLNLDFMEKVLRKSEGDDSIQVIDIFTKPATSKGDNYTSDMFRVVTEFTRKKADKAVTEKRPIIVKVAPLEEGVRKDLIGQSGLFITEMSMMTDTLKKMNALLDPKHVLSARGLYVQKENPMLLVVQDLAQLGFRMADREAGLDLAHSSLAIQSLARFHATSVAVCEKEPAQKKMYYKGMFSNEYPKEMRMFFASSIKSLAEEVKNWPDFGPSYADKIRRFGETAYDKGIECIQCDENEFKVIAHGDTWVNNMLFKYDDNGKPIGHIFVDFQLCHYTSPAIDLHYFLSTSLNSEVYDEYRGLLIDLYHKTLCATMRSIGCKTPPPTFEELRKSLRKRNDYAMIAAFTVLPIVIVEKSKAKELNEILSANGGFDNPGIKSEAFRLFMRKRLPRYDELGLFDY